MPHDSSVDAGMAVSLALAAGMVAQSLARHLKLPGIVLLLGAGILLGPDLLGVVNPQSLGPALHILVGFSVSVVLFEGGLNLGWRRLQSQARVIQLLITVGALITGLGGALSVHYIMDWDWRLSAAFGSLVIVTGPTVVTPLLRRIKVTHRVETVLEAEGVLIDAVGAVLAVVTLQVLISPSGSSVADGLVGIVSRLGFGIVCGVVGGLIIVLALHFRSVVPDGLENVFTLSLVLALFQFSNFWLAESGIMSVTAAGMVVGNSRTRVQRELMEFKEQLTIMLIGMLFVLLAADVRMAEVRALGWPGIATVAALMLLVRPLNIVISTIGSDLSGREKLLLSWISPRGVVAAAVASLFGQTLGAAGIPGGERLTALVFSVIAGTVLIQGLSGGIVARMLGLRRPTNRGYAIFGGNELGRSLGCLLRDSGHEVVFLERDPIKCQRLQEDGFRVVYGNILEERTLLRARLDERSACIAVTTNEEVNFLVARMIYDEFKIKHVYVACRKDRLSVSAAVIKRSDVEVLFGRPRDLDLWDLRIRRDLVSTEPWRLDAQLGDGREEVAGKRVFDVLHNLVLPLVLIRNGKSVPVNSKAPFRKGDIVHFALYSEQREKAEAWLLGHQWSRASELDAGMTRSKSISTGAVVAADDWST